MDEDSSRKEIAASVTYPPATSEVEVKVKVKSLEVVELEEFQELLKQINRVILIKGVTEIATDFLLNILGESDNLDNRHQLECEMVCFLVKRIDRAEGDPLSR